MIEVTQLTKKYGERKAIDNLNFSIQAGSVVGFLGPNGAGKSTTMKILSGYMPATSGVARISDLDVFENPLAVKSMIGYLPEVPPVYEDMYVQDYLRFVAHLKNVSSENIVSYVGEALEKTQLETVKNRWVGNLSKGYKQRVGIAGALVSKPKVLILDEPTVGLDPNQVQEIRSLILNLKGDHTLLISTHILSEVQATCERVIIINEGSIVVQDTLENLTQKNDTPKSYEVEVLRDEDKLKKNLNQLPGVIKITPMSSGFEIHIDSEQLSGEQLSGHIVGSGSGLVGFRAGKSPGLESIFQRLTHRKRRQDKQGASE